MALPAPAEPLSGADRGARQHDRSTQHSLIIQTAFIGDTILTTPLIAELATRGPVDIVTTPMSATLLQNNPALRRISYSTSETRRAGSAGCGRWRGRFGVGVPSMRNRKSNRCLPGPGLDTQRGVGGPRGGRAHRIRNVPCPPMYTKRVPYIENQHHAARLWLLAFPHEQRAEPRPSGSALAFSGRPRKSAVNDLLREHGLSGPFVALARVACGRPAVAYYAELAARVTTRLPWS